MRVLILSWYFPPVNEIGALRVGKLADFLHGQGHEVWVVSADRAASDRSLSLELPAERVIRTPWIDIDRISSPWRRGQQTDSVGDGTAAVPVTPHRHGSLRKALSENYMWLVRFPDRHGGWFPYLRQAAAALMRKRTFDLIYASGPPFTTFVAAAGLSRKFGVPWVAEYRDGWSRYQYTPKPEWRERIDTFIENRVTRSAARIVAVTGPWADYYRKMFGKPTIDIYNGFDEAEVKEPSAGSPGLPLSIVHMGTVYSGLRDPSVLFEAIKRSGISSGEVEISFYGAAPHTVLPLAAAAGVRDFVKVPARVPYQQALEIQRQSDVLLLLQSPTDSANVPAKTFEYFAARRPILGLGLDDGIPARLVRERNAGLYATDPGRVAEQLKQWVETKRTRGTIAPLPGETLIGLSRTDQFLRLQTFLDAEVKGSPRVSISSETSRPEVTGMMPSGPDAIVSFAPGTKPQLLVIVDAEEEFDWTKPFSPGMTSVTNMNLQHLAHHVFAGYGVVPTYTVDYAVADQEEGYKPLLEFVRDGACEIGAQLHPWVTPPLVEEVGEYNSYPGNLPEELEYLKLKTLTTRIQDRFGQHPRLYRAGRFGAGPNTARILKQLGYSVDCSVLSQRRLDSPYAPDNSLAPAKPYWIGEDTDLLEIPVTQSTIGVGRKFERQLSPFLFSEIGCALRLPGILARLRLFDRIRLSPEGITLDEAKRLTRFQIDRGHVVFVVTYHTPSLGIGHTPYVRSERDLDRFLAWLDGYCDFFFNEIKGVASTPGKIRAMALEAVRQRQLSNSAAAAAQ